MQVFADTLSIVPTADMLHQVLPPVKLAIMRTGGDPPAGFCLLLLPFLTLMVQPLCLLQAQRQPERLNERLEHPLQPLGFGVRPASAKLPVLIPANVQRQVTCSTPRIGDGLRFVYGFHNLDVKPFGIHRHGRCRTPVIAGHSHMNGSAVHSHLLMKPSKTARQRSMRSADTCRSGTVRVRMHQAIVIGFC